ncbi:MAG: acid phosphatase, partial [Chloroflexi bacterium]|nr:acid phosphatase [Chloroflexota bacterium]
MTGFLASAALVAAPRGPASQAAAQPADLSKINHVVVIYEENWSFDGLYGKFPGANGIDNAGGARRQVDKNGKPYDKLPQPLNTNFTPSVPDPRFPADLDVAPFDTTRYVGPNQLTGDLVHRFYQEQYQIDGGKMDKFVSWSDAAGLVMSYYDATNMPEGKLAQQYTMMDDFFHSGFGGSFFNHQYLICACAPVWPDAPDNVKAETDANGLMVKDGQVTPDGYVVNTSFTINSPHPA